MSRWTTPCWWACSSASAACDAQLGHRAEEGPAAGRAARRGGRRRAGGADAAAAARPGGGRSRGRRRDRLGRASGPRPAVASVEPARRGRRLAPLRPVEPPQLADHLGQGLALDELHGVVVHAALAADGVDRHDVGVVQAGRGLGLELEPLQLPGVQRRGERQHLQRHPAAERDLLGLVDDAHAAAADLAERCGSRPARPARGPAVGPAAAAGRVPDGRAAQVGQHRERRQQPAELLGLLRVLAGAAPRGPPARRPGAGRSARRPARPGPGRPRLVAGRRSADRSSRSSSVRRPARPRSRTRARSWRISDGPLADPQHGGDLGGRQLLQVPQDQHLAVARRPAAARAARTRSPQLVADQAAAGAGAAGQQPVGQLQRPTRRAGGMPALLAADAPPPGLDVAAVQLDQPLPGEPPQPGVERQRAVPQVVVQAAGRRRPGPPGRRRRGRRGRPAGGPGGRRPSGAAGRGAGPAAPAGPPSSPRGGAVEQFLGVQRRGGIVAVSSLEIDLPERPKLSQPRSRFFSALANYGHTRLLQARGSISSAAMRFTRVAHGPDLEVRNGPRKPSQSLNVSCFSLE